MTKQMKLLAACMAVGSLAALAGAAQAASATDSSSQGVVRAAPNSKFAKQPGDLSDKLDASNGVIRPKEVDPAIEKKPPPAGAAAVIPPPGSPGGPQGAQPK